MEHAGHPHDTMVHHAAMINASMSVEPLLPSYFADAEYSSILLIHIVVMTAAWVIVLPISM